VCALLPWVLAPLGLGLSGRSDSQGISQGISQGELSGGALRGSSQGELSGGSWLLRACARGRAKCGDPGGRKGPVAAWGEAVYLPPEGCVTARGSYWNVWPGDLDLLRLMEPTGGPAYRSTAMVAVIKAKGVLLFASAVVAPSVAAGSVCTVFQGGRRTVLLGLRSPDTCRQFPCRAKKMDTSLGAVSIKVLFPEDIQSPGSAGLWGLLRRGSESREPVPGKRGSRGAMKPWEGAECLSDRSMDSGGGPTVLIWCSFVHGIGCLVTGVSAHWCIRYPHPVIQAPVSE